MNDIKISVIMPVYNAGKYLKIAVDSLINQTYKNFKLWLIDDGSTDGSGKVCDDFAQNYDNIEVVHKKNGGICDARNVGLSYIEDGYVYFMDNDDVLDEHAFEIMNKALSEERFDVLTFGARLTNIEKSVTTSTIDRVLPDFTCVTKDDIKDALPKYFNSDMLLCVWDKLYRTQYLKTNNISFNSFFTHGGEDFDFNLNIIKTVPKIKNINSVLYNYYIRDTQSTYRKFNGNVYLHTLKNLNLTTEIIKQYELDMQNFIYVRFIEYRLRLIFMLCHSQCNMNKREKVEICKKNFSNDGYNIIFRSKALLDYLKLKGVSFKKKILVVACCYNMHALAVNIVMLWRKNG